eukprot:scaffold2679_cov251-Pinguiococcus_pyrenoidosus.AAC.18
MLLERWLRLWLLLRLLCLRVAHLGRRRGSLAMRRRRADGCGELPPPLLAGLHLRLGLGLFLPQLLERADAAEDLQPLPHVALALPLLLLGPSGREERLQLALHRAHLVDGKGLHDPLQPLRGLSEEAHLQGVQRHHGHLQQLVVRALGLYRLLPGLGVRGLEVPGGALLLGTQRLQLALRLRIRGHVGAALALVALLHLAGVRANVRHDPLALGQQKLHLREDALLGLDERVDRHVHQHLGAAAPGDLVEVHPLRAEHVHR